MGFSLYACRTTTGQNLGRLPGVPQSWQRVLNSSEVAGASIPRGAIDPQTLGTTSVRDNVNAWTTPWLMTLVIDWNGTIVWAGPISGRQPQTDLSISAVGLKTLFTRREAINWTTPYASQSLSYPSTISLGSIAAQLAATATDPTKPGAVLPLVLPPQTADSNPANAATLYGYDLHSVSDVFDLLTSFAGGPDIDFAPQWTDANRSALQWVMRVGTPAAPKLMGATVQTFDATQPGSSVQSLTVQEDASKLTTAAWSKGSGTGTGTLMSLQSSQALTALGMPLLEQEIDHTEATTQAQLDALATGDLATNAGATVQWSMGVNAAGTPQLGTYQVGDAARVNVRRHWWIPDGEYGMRILGISGDGSNTVQLALQASTARGVNVLGTVDGSMIGRLARLERDA